MLWLAMPLLERGSSLDKRIPSPFHSIKVTETNHMCVVVRGAVVINEPAGEEKYNFLGKPLTDLQKHCVYNC